MKSLSRVDELDVQLLSGGVWVVVVVRVWFTVLLLPPRQSHPSRPVNLCCVGHTHIRAVCSYDLPKILASQMNTDIKILRRISITKTHPIFRSSKCMKIMYIVVIPDFMIACGILWWIKNIYFSMLQLHLVIKWNASSVDVAGVAGLKNSLLLDVNRVMTAW